MLSCETVNFSPGTPEIRIQLQCGNQIIKESGKYKLNDGHPHNSTIVSYAYESKYESTSQPSIKYGTINVHPRFDWVGVLDTASQCLTSEYNIHYLHGHTDREC